MGLTIIDDNGTTETFSTDVPPTTELSCQVCGTELTYGGRGPKPKYCDEHRKTRTGGPSATSRKSSASVESLINSIEGFHMMVGSALAFTPITAKDGMVVMSNARQVAESWKTLLERSPEWRKRWEKFFEISGTAVVVGAYVTMIGLPVAQNHGLIKMPTGFTPPATAPNPTPPTEAPPVSPFGTTGEEN